VLIVTITGDTYSGWLPQEAWDWLRKPLARIFRESVGAA
jgi:hypothetical protein